MTVVYKEPGYEIHSMNYMCHPETCCHDAHHPFKAVDSVLGKSVGFGSIDECKKRIEYDKGHKHFCATYPFMKLHGQWRDVSVSGKKPRLRCYTSQ
jgi:hypothetical protein